MFNYSILIFVNESVWYAEVERLASKNVEKGAWLQLCCYFTGSALSNRSYL